MNCQIVVMDILVDGIKIFLTCLDRLFLYYVLELRNQRLNLGLASNLRFAHGSLLLTNMFVAVVTQLKN